MTAAELVLTLRSGGVKLALAQLDRLVYQAPPEVLTGAVREALAAHKADLLALLAAEDAAGYRVGERVAYGGAVTADGDAGPHPGTCPGCGRVNLGRLPGARIACECGTVYTRPNRPRAFSARPVVGTVVDVATAGIAVRWLGRDTEARYTIQEAGAWLSRADGPVVAVALVPRPCSTCGSTGSCASRSPQPDGGWACRAALSNGLLGTDGRRRRPGERRVPA